MNMLYKIGDHVGYVSVDCDFASVPADPDRWYPLCIFSGCDAKVMKAFAERGFNGWSPTVTSFASRTTGRAARKPHLGRRIVRPFLPGWILLPDFELPKLGLIRNIPGVDDLLRMDWCRPYFNRAEIAILRDIVAAESLPPSQRKRAQVEIGQRVRIAEGAFSGFNALIEAVDSKGRLNVYVEAGERGVKVSNLTDTQIEVI
jgi:transcriptional antiterminator NusG